MKRIGLDAGSTTVKCVVLDEKGELIYSKYERHMSKISEKCAELIKAVADKFNGEKMSLAVSGSAGMGMASDLDLTFIQEVYATRIAVKAFLPKTDTVIELGGEDAKILFLTDAMEVRMNGSCAGGTGAFIDQMASLMNVTPAEMEALASDYTKLYTVASRCGVFAKSDIQPLINQGAKKEDIAASIFYAVVNQTVAGLAQGRQIDGNVLYLGGPLTFFPFLRSAFDRTLMTQGTCPENSLYFVAMGAALSADNKEYDLYEIAARAENYSSKDGYTACKPLFKSEGEYREFINRHSGNSSHISFKDKPKGKVYIGIDSGSTTVKAVVIDEEGGILRPIYRQNSGNPIPIIREYLLDLYKSFKDIEIGGVAVTGYGEAIVKHAFHADLGIVETVAHYTAASEFCPGVDFILDIGGQDIKCFKIKNGGIDSIFLNEACSSGCGSFLQTFASVLGYSNEEFAKLGLYAEKPVDLGSRCTVFMNSSVKQAQKDGATIDNISAGLSISVVKNALYKVIRCANPDNLGENIVVQGGTFMNDAVLRAFEMETGKEVIRPNIAGLMGAYGAALYAKSHSTGVSTLITENELENFTHTVKAISCKGCTNNCSLTVNTFSGTDTYIAGNRCEKPINKGKSTVQYNMYEYKNSLLSRYCANIRDMSKKTVAIPRVLNMYELLPFWYTLFTELGYNVIVSPESNRKLYLKGQHTIPSDTACYPAKLVHGHIDALLEEKPDVLFYPCMSYNVDEGLGKNHYNCPVVAYYPTVIASNVKEIKDVQYINGFISIHDKKEFIKHFIVMMKNYGIDLKVPDVKRAAKKAYFEYSEYMRLVREKAEEYISIAKKENMPVIVLSGRPYHIDPEINHGVDKLICELGAVVITEDSVSGKVGRIATTVLNQWTYHARLYTAAEWVARQENENIHMVQLVSFGCGVDAVTTDEVRAILESRGKPYTQIKIDEIANLGAIKIRLRSLFATL
ncbi:MAG: 2-hydroxyglutaryl-CoA dehydratase [Ruminococcaceae bacterium]|nr:2-hydroxyglutaryl-CoA dehydratase [Oscillospiraceae bacterium]